MDKQLRTPDRDLQLLKSVFADNDRLLRLLKNLLVGLPITDAEKEEVRAIPEEAKNILKKRFLGEMNPEQEVGQANDIWAGVEARGFHPDFIRQNIEAREALIELSKRALSLLDDPNGDKIALNYSSSMLADDPWGVKFIARQSFLSQVDGQLLLIKMLVGTKTETVEEAKKRLQKDSLK